MCVWLLILERLGSTSLESCQTVGQPEFQGGRLQLDFEATSLELSIVWPPMSAFRRMQELVPKTGGVEALSQVGERVWFANTHESCEAGRMPKEELQKVLWKQFFAHPTQCWDNGRNKPTPRRHPDFMHKKLEIDLWLKNRHLPPRVGSQIAMWDAGMKGRPPDTAYGSVDTQMGFGKLRAHEYHREIGMCRKLCEDGRITDAVESLSHLVQRRCYVPSNLFYRVLNRCVADKDLVMGRRIHVLTIQSGYEGDAFLATHLMGVYGSRGRLKEALRVFAKVSTPSSYNWATIIFAYARHGAAAEAIRLYRQMRQSTTVEPTNHIYVAVLKACASARDFAAGQEIHAHILASPVEANIFVQTGLIKMYSDCGSLEDAHKVFNLLPERDVVSWNALLAGYAHHGMGQEALSLYNSMQQEGLTAPDSVTYVSVLQACSIAGVAALNEGKQLHAQIEDRGLESDLVLGNSLVNMYAKCGSLENARHVFERLPERDVVSWTAMIAGYGEHRLLQEALNLYGSMQQEGVSPNSVTFLCLLQACASVGAPQEGKKLHAETEERGLQVDVVVGGSLVNMYAKCGSLEDARTVFDSLPVRNVATWNAIIAGYAQQEMCDEALSLYTTMQHEGNLSPDSVTFACLLQACASVSALPLGKQLHAQIEEHGLHADPAVGAALVNMYAKCGSMFDSQRVFDSLSERSIETWNALTGGCTRQGDSQVVFDLLERMRLEGINADGVTYLSVLTVCSHAGKVDKGQSYFDAMRAESGIRPTLDHYACMLDLLGRAGHLDEALQMATTMPFPANSAVWRTLLGACRKWNNVEIGQLAFECAVSVDGKDAASYVLMSTIYASAEMWEAAKEMQTRRLKARAWKEPGQSWWTDLNGVVHMFVVGEKKHWEGGGVSAKLEQLVPSTKKATYLLDHRP